jgi:3-phosphoshikimate 1-carboxyvinyltransferase
VPTRDHSERMLRGFGADLTLRSIRPAPASIRIRGEAELKPQVIEVPGDPLFCRVLHRRRADGVPGSELTIENVGLNPTRAGLIEVLRQMGGSIEELEPREVGGEPVADLLVKHSHAEGHRRSIRPSRPA